MTGLLRDITVIGAHAHQLPIRKILYFDGIKNHDVTELFTNEKDYLITMNYIERRKILNLYVSNKEYFPENKIDKKLMKILL